MSSLRDRATRLGVLAAFGATFLLGASTVLASSPGTDVRLSNDVPAGGYVSADDLAGLPHYTDATLNECSRSRGRQNEPALAINPRDSRVMIGSANDYCGVYNDGEDGDGAPIASGPIWLGYYRSQNSGCELRQLARPGLSGRHLDPRRARQDPHGQLPAIRWSRGTAQGRVFMGSESSDDPAGTKKTFGDEWVARYVNPGGPGGNTLNDGKRFAGSVDRGQGLLRAEPPRQVPRQDRDRGRPHEQLVQRQRLLRLVAVHGQRRRRDLLRPLDRPRRHLLAADEADRGVHDVQLPEISVTGNGHVYVTYGQFEDSGQQVDGVGVVKSTDCGRSFSTPATIIECRGDGPDRCAARRRHRPRLRRRHRHRLRVGYTFFRADTGPRSTSDQTDTAHEWVYVVYEAIVPGTRSPTGHDLRLGRRAGRRRPVVGLLRPLRRRHGDAHRRRQRVAPIRDGQQIYPDLAVDAGTVHALWWDTRNDVNNDATSMLVRPPGNDADGNVGPLVRRVRSDPPDRRRPWSSDVRAHRRDVERPVGAVRRPDRAVRRRLPLDRLGRRPHLRDVDRLAEHASPGTDLRETVRGRDRRRRPPVPARYRRWRDLRRHVSARRRTRPGHLRRSGTVNAQIRPH